MSQYTYPWNDKKKDEDQIPYSLHVNSRLKTMFVLLLSDKISYSMYTLVRKKALIYEKRENFGISTCFNLLKNIRPQHSRSDRV